MEVSSYSLELSLPSLSHSLSRGTEVGNDVVTSTVESRFADPLRHQKVKRVFTKIDIY